MPLVDEDELGTEETKRLVSEWHRDRKRLTESNSSIGAPSASVDITTGWVLVGLSTLFLVGTYSTAVSMGGGVYFIAFGPFTYGMFRLNRGWRAKKPTSTKPRR